MNIFVLDRDPQKAAQMLCDKHVVKMLLETAQILCTVLHGRENHGALVPYKPTHKNHPCVIWAEKPEHTYWLLLHGLSICAEYTFRYGKIHKSEAVINSIAPYIEVTYDTPDFFALAMPDKYKSIDRDPVASYRAYYIGEKSGIATWKKRDKPEWFINDTETT